MYLVFIVANLLFSCVLTLIFRLVLKKPSSGLGFILTAGAVIGVINLADILAWDRWHRIACNNSGNHVYQTEHVEGFYIQSIAAGSATAVLKKGYAFAEIDAEPRGSGYLRFEKVQGDIAVVQSPTLKSQYVKYVSSDHSQLPEMAVSTIVIQHLATGQRVGETKIYFFYGGPLFRWFSKKLHHDRPILRGQCPDSYIELITDKVIPPIKP